MTDSNATNYCHLLWPQQNQCSYNGKCQKIDESESVVGCVCNSQYTSIGDFAVVDLVDCDISIVAIKALNIISLLSSFISFIFCTRYFFLRYKSLQANKDLKWSDSINFLPFSGLFYNSSLAGYNISKIIDPINNSVGISLLTTLFLVLIFSFFWISQTIFVYFFSKMTVAQSLLKGEEFRKKTIERFLFLKKALAIILTLNLVWGFILLAPLYDPKTAQIAAAIHYIGALFDIICVGYLIIPAAVGSLRDDIRQALKENNFDEVKIKKIIKEQGENQASNNSSSINLSRLLAMSNAEKKLTTTLKFLSDQVAQQFIIACVFGLWPYFTRKISYQLPLTYIVGALLISLEVYSISNFRSSRKKKQIDAEATTPSSSHHGATRDSQLIAPSGKRAQESVA